MHTNFGVFLTLEGIEGVGKSTAISYIKEFLTLAKKEFVITREPGGTAIAEKIREVLLIPTEEVMQPEAELLLMFASRIQHVNHVIRPALQANKWVISDRFVDASYAYQGGGRGVPLVYLQQLDQWIVNGIQPDCTILLDAPPEIGLARAKHRAPHDRIEQEQVDFFTRAREVYLQRAEKFPERFRIIDATQPLKVVQGELKKILEELISHQI